MGSTDDFDSSVGGLSVNDQASEVAAALNQAQIDIEAEKSALVRTLHDDLGGLLVGAIMDMGWISSQHGLPQVVRDKLSRAQGLLKAAIDLKRELIETLRPTLLDNVGLFSTLRWHMKARCEGAAIPYAASLPASEEALSSEIRIGVFRIFQEALGEVLSTHSDGDLALKVEIIGDTLHCHLIHQSSELADNQINRASSSETSMHHRARRLGGLMRWKKTGAGSHMHLQVPTTAASTS
jgi:signal transduction histidine kinase